MFYNMLPATGREFCIKIFNCPCCLINLSALPGGPSTVSIAASACQLCLEDLQLSLLPHQPVSSAWRTFSCPCCLINLSALPGGPSTAPAASSTCQLCLEDLQLSLLPHQPVSCLENLQLQISRVIRVIIKELLNRGAGFGRRVTGKSG